MPKFPANLKKTLNHFINNLLVFLFGVMFLTACSSYKKGPISQGFHNTTAHYNAYFIANEHVKEIEASLENSYQWNYNRVLPIFVEFDTTDTKQFEDQLEDIIQKSSIAIQRHPGSAWEDDAYILVGQARFFNYEFQDAVETYKYVNTHSENDNARHRALVELMHTFVKNNELNNAVAVSDYLKREDLSKSNLRGLYLNRAYLYQVKEDLNNMVSNLVKAEEYLKKKKEKARINFIIGQVYQELGFEAEAYNFYRKVLKFNPSYELSFYTKLNMAQVTELANTSDTRKIRKYFRKLLNDEKNEEYRDKIYYEIGNFELKQGNLDEAISAFKSSVESSVNNQRQKGYSFWELGKIYYDSIKNYELAKNYYDSTVSTLPQDEELYPIIQARQQILSDFVKQINIIQDNDSLLALGKMDPATLDKFLDEYIAIKKAEEEKLEEERKKRERRNQMQALNTSEDIIQLGSEEGATWYFYNLSAVSKGKNEFRRIWGTRQLEDHWRRSNKQVLQSNSPQSGDQDQTTANLDNTSGQNQSVSGGSTLDKDALLSTIPRDSASQSRLLAEVEVAHYELGKIYHFNLYEDKNAMETFDNLLVRFPISEYKPEVLYLQYLLSKEIDSTKTSGYANTLITEFPNTVYAKLIENPNYREESFAIKSKLEKLYKQCYTMYDTGNYKSALNNLDASIAEYPDNVFTDNMALLRVLVIGKMDNIFKYQFELSNFKKSYPESELIPYVDKLIKESEEHQLNLISSSKAKWSKNLERKHLCVIAYENKENTASEIIKSVESDLEKIEGFDDLRIGNLILDDQHAMVLINEFEDEKKASAFLVAFNQISSLEKAYQTIKIYKFVITDSNFNTLYQTKELESYRKFFSRNYTTNQ